MHPSRNAPPSPRPATGRRIARLLLAVALTLLAVLVSAAPAAAVTRAEKLAVLADWTRPALSSYRAWNAARLDQAAWAEYRFDWSTDECSASPDQPLGFDFRLPCRRHDFGYRNYRAVDLFTPNKARVDNAFHADLKRRCATYPLAVRPACLSVAWIYYQAVKAFGSTAAVSSVDLRRIARAKAAAEAAAAPA